MLKLPKHYSLIFLLILFLDCQTDKNPISGENLTNPKILFTADTKLCLVDQDGNNFKILRTGLTNHLEAKWSPTGSQIIFTDLIDNDVEVYLMDLDGNITNNVSDNDFFDEFPSYSPVGDFIMFVSSINWINHLFLRKINNWNLIELTNGYNSYRPEFSPDGSKITFQSSHGADSSGVFIMTVDGSDLNYLGPGNVPHFSPVMDKIMYQKFYPPYDNQMFIMNLDGSAKQYLSNIPFQTYPKFSPDGSKIVFSNFNQNYNSDIYIINSDGTNIQNITNSSNLAEFQPLFYPNGSKILFVLLELGKPEQLCSIDIDTKNIKTIIQDIGHILYPTFQPGNN